MNEKITYEEGIVQLEEIVEKLENGTTTLDESFREYERGVKLYNTLKAVLAQGEAKIIELTKDGAKEIEGKSDADA